MYFQTPTFTSQEFAKAQILVRQADLSDSKLHFSSIFSQKHVGGQKRAKQASEVHLVNHQQMCFAAELDNTDTVLQCASLLVLQLLMFRKYVEGSLFLSCKIVPIFYHHKSAFFNENLDALSYFCSSKQATMYYS